MDPSQHRLVIVAPPESGKTSWCVAYCAWLIGNNPAVHIGYIANTYLQAARQSVAVRETIRRNERYRRVFPEVRLDENRGTSEARWFVARPDPSDKDATFQITGYDGPILGARLDIAIVDDYSDAGNTATAYQRDKAWEWFQTNVVTRLNPDRGRIIVIQTRWAEDDLAGRLERQGARLMPNPAIKDGKPLWPERWSLEGLLARRAQMGGRLFDMQYQGIVRPPQGNVFKHEWWRYWSSTETCFQRHPGAPCPHRMQVHPEPQWMVASLDTAFKTGRENDYSVATVWALCRNGHYLLDMWRRRVEFPQLVQAVLDLHARWHPHYYLIEDEASGQSLIQELRQKTRLPIQPVKVDRDKRARAEAVTPELETGRVFLPREAPWREEFEYELEVFPLGEHDDIVDSVTQYLNWARGRGAGRQCRPFWV